MKQAIVIGLICFLLAACTTGSRKTPAISFYYWRTSFELSDKEWKAIQENGVEKLYIRYFDVDTDGANSTQPVSPISFKQNVGQLSIVPVVYIKNAVMLQDSLNTGELAKNIVAYIDKIDRAAGNKENNEIQVDCDWTLKSRDRFMQFVDTLREISGKKLSATIRLHQVKYFTTTHVPNVDKAVLMYYNMGKIAPDTLNSIYDRKVAERYIESLNKYPMPLIPALPIYSWGVHIRDNRVKGLVNKVDKTIFENDTAFLLSPQSRMITVKHSNIKGGRYFLHGDRIKIEDVAHDELLQMAIDLKKQLNYQPEEIIFFDLDQINIKKYEKETDFFKKVAARF